MHEFDAEDGKEPSKAAQNPKDGQGVPGKARPMPVQPLPDELRNWQVIDGEATVVDEPDGDSTQPSPEQGDHAGEFTAAIADQGDDIIVASLATRQLTINPGDTAIFRLTILNNGPEAAPFKVTVEGWLDEAWVQNTPIHTRIEPGQRTTIDLAIAPPRRPATVASERSLAILVHSPSYPGRYSRVGAQLTIRPYGGFQLEHLHPTDLKVTWFRRHTTGRVALVNRGNYPVTVDLQAARQSPHERDPGCTFEFRTSAALPFQLGHLAVPLEAGETIPVEVRIIPHEQPVFAWEPQITSFRLVAKSVQEGSTSEKNLPQSLDFELANAPLIRPWHVASLSTLLVMSILLVGLVVVAGLLLMQNLARPTAAPAAAVAPAAAPIAIILKVGEPLPTRGAEPLTATPGLPDVVAQPGAVRGAPSVTAGNPASSAADAGVPSVSAANVTAPGEPAGEPIGALADAPLVLPSQVTAPGEPAAPSVPLISAQPGVQSVQPQAVTQPGAASVPAPAPQTATGPTTYAQMFQEIGLRFDLNWRMLAAQAYVESGFNSLALGSSGDMGLMQILPPTWKQWAPAVNASDPFDSYSNTLVAAVYLDHLRSLLSQAGYPEQQWMLVAYNWGPDKLLAHLRNGGSWETLAEQQRNYALSILQIADSIPAN